MIGSNRETLRKIVEDVAKVPAQWARHPAPFVSPGDTVRTGAVFNPTATTPTASDLAGKTRLVMRILSSRDHGVDEMRREYDEDEETGTVTQTGIRHYTLSITCVGYGATEPSEVLELLRTRIQRSANRVRLRAINIALVDMLGIVDLPVMHSPTFEAGREAVLDMKIAWGLTDEVVEEDFIETVGLGEWGDLDPHS